MDLFPEAFGATRVRLLLRLEAGAEFPEFLGATLRGGFGRALRRVSCRRGDSACAGCAVDRCAYRILFESPRPPGVGGRLSFERVPHPFVLEAPYPHRGSYAAGEVLHVGFVAVGSALDFVPEVLEAFVLLGTMGLGNPRQRFSVERAEFQRGLWPEEFAPWRGGECPPCVIGSGQVRTLADKVSGQPLRVVAETPVRIEARGKPVDFRGSDLCWAAARRVWNLAELYCGARYSGQLATVRDLAQSVLTGDCRLEWKGWIGFSRRQGKTVALSGYVGTLSLKKVPRELLSFVLAGSLVHVGKHTMFGLGKYSLALSVTRP